MPKIAFITGASSGIGLLSAVELARRNYHVIATMRDPARRDRLDKAASEAGMSDRIGRRPVANRAGRGIPDLGDAVQVSAAA